MTIEQILEGQKRADARRQKKLDAEFERCRTATYPKDPWIRLKSKLSHLNFDLEPEPRFRGIAGTLRLRLRCCLGFNKALQDVSKKSKVSMSVIRRLMSNKQISLCSAERLAKYFKMELRIA